MDTAPRPLDLVPFNDVAATPTTRTVFPHAAFDLPLIVPDAWTQPSRSRIVRFVSRALAPIDQPGGVARAPMTPPAPGFWAVYARQRGFEAGDPLWVRELPAPPVRGRGTLSFTSVLEGKLGAYDVHLAACTTRRSRRGTGAHLVMGTRVSGSTPDARRDPTGEGQIGWVVRDGMFTAWLDVVPIMVRDAAREDQPSSQRRRRLMPLVDERLVDWFCLHALELVESLDAAAPAAASDAA